MCPERRALSDAVVAAVEAVYFAEEARDLAVKEKRELDSCDLVLAGARLTETRTVAALNQHRKEHGC
jgi:hypothetical protein